MGESALGEEFERDWERRERERKAGEDRWRALFAKAALAAEAEKARMAEGLERAKARFAEAEALMERENPAEAEEIRVFARRLHWEPDLGGERFGSRVRLEAAGPKGREWEGEERSEAGGELEAADRLCARALAELFWLGEYEPETPAEAKRLGFYGNGCQSFCARLPELGAFGEELERAFADSRRRRERERSIEAALGKALEAQTDSGGVLSAARIGRALARVDRDGSVWLEDVMSTRLFGGGGSLFLGGKEERRFRLGSEGDGEEALVGRALEGLARLWLCSGRSELDLGAFSARAKAAAERLALGSEAKGTEPGRAPRGM